MSNTQIQKRNAARRALQFIPEDAYIGVGTGSTVNLLIEELAEVKGQIRGAVPTSNETSQLLRKVGIKIVDLAESGKLPVYIDGADEINHTLQMIKGGGGALLAEKVVANASQRFVCIADESKYVARLGKFPLPVEVAVFAQSIVAAELIKLGGVPELRVGFTTRSGHHILDVTGLDLSAPMKMEDTLLRIPGVMECGIFAHRPADILVLGNDDDAEIIKVSALA